jgi:hypothetical protein
MTSDEKSQVVLLVRLSEGDGARGLHLRVLGESEALCLADSADFVLRLWWETPDIVRASITNVQSGSVAMLQGNRALRKLAKEIGLIKKG